MVYITLLKSIFMSRQSITLANQNNEYLKKTSCQRRIYEQK